MRAMQSFVESCTENVSYLGKHDHVMEQHSGFFLDCLRLLDPDHSPTNRLDLAARITAAVDPIGKIRYEIFNLNRRITHDAANKSPRSVMK